MTTQTASTKTPAYYAHLSADRQDEENAYRASLSVAQTVRHDAAMTASIQSNIRAAAK